MSQQRLRRGLWLRCWIAVAALGVMGACAWAQEVGPPANVGEAGAEAQISEYVRRVFQDRDGHLWFGTNGDGVCRYDGKSLTYLSVQDGLAGAAIRGIVQDGDGAMWFGTDGGVSRYKDGVFTNFGVQDGLSDANVWSMMRDRAGTIWAGTHEGVCRLEGEAFVAFPLPRVEVERPESRFSPRVVFAMLEDRAGNLWFGSDGEGVHRYDGKAFTSYTTKDGLAGNMVRSLCEDRLGRIWIGTDGGGVSCYDGTAFRTVTAEDGLSNNRVWGVMEDRAGNMWFSTLGAGVCRYDGTMFRAFGASDGLTKTHVQSMLEDRDGTLWFGCSGGLFRLEGEWFVNVTREGPWEAAAARRMEGSIPEPMRRFERLVGGEWKMVTDTEVGLITKWDWGPGRYSLRGVVDGVGGDRRAWRALNVVYWHSASKQVRSLGVSQYREGVAEGVIGINGETWENVAVMHQTGDRRNLKSRWTFDGADRFHDELMESKGAEEYFPLTSWDWVRTTLPATPRAFEVDDAPKPSERLAAFAPLLDRTWQTSDEGDGPRLRTTFEWIPLSNVVCVRTVELVGEAEAALVMDAYIHYHTGRKAVRCLALTKDGGVYEGDVRVIEGGALEADLRGHAGDRSVGCVARVEFEHDGAVRLRLWTVEGAERSLTMDVRHARIGP